MEERRRCRWAGDNDWNRLYHDEEWGVPVHDDVRLFEFLILEGAQAGLSWLTILKRRENYRKAFDGFDFHKIARYGEAEKEALLQNPGIIRNRLKIEAAVDNARRTLEIIGSHGSLDAYLWSFVDHRPVQNAWERLEDIPTETEISRRMSRDLKRRGFKFVGPTICYAFMQAVGMVNDHEAGCFRHGEVRALSE